MQLNIHLPTDEIAKQVNHLYGQVIFDGEVAELGLRIKIRKRAPIQVFCKDDKLYVEAPLEVYTKVILKEKFLGIFDVITPNIEETDFEITAQYETSIREDAYWRLKANTTADFSWDRKPQWNLLVFKVRISSLIKPFIKTQIQEVAERINDFIEKEIQLERHAQTAWQTACLPIRLEENPPLWLMIHPERQDAFRRPIHFGKEEIFTDISLPVNLHAYLGKARESGEKTEMPPFEEKDEIEKVFQTQLSSHLPYRDLCALLIGQDIALDKERLQFHIRSMGMKTKNGKLNTSLSLQGSLKRFGRRFPFRLVMFISTRPYIDPENGRIKIQLLDHEFLTPHWWLKAYKRLASKAFAKQLTRGLNDFIESIDQQVVERIREALMGREIDDLLRLHGSLDAFEHTELLIHPHELELRSTLKGELQVKIILAAQAA